MPLMLPLDDQNPRRRLPHPWVNWTLIALCIGVFTLQYVSPAQLEFNLIHTFGAVPRLLFQGPFEGYTVYGVPSVVSLITYAFLHGGIMHLLVNMLVLWVYGDNVEDAMGHSKYLFFYLLCAVLAVVCQIVVEPTSLSPIIGASGALAGVMGAYFVLYPRAKLLVPILIFPVYLPAYLVLSLWMLFQLVAAFQADSAAAGVAWWAHIGGFVAGALLVKLFLHKAHLRIAPHEVPKGVELNSFTRDHNAKRARTRRDEM